ncbi:nad dependent epimerase [Fusarium denticulatum]|uniref:Nad dependent epimerase n=1 Tax=Fusarium denticulatum TaxID=48507 RepID=A0A8H6CUG7_9HYPO|nr:nad dependent epimerase [Fusarium denticulatum]
MSTPQIFVSGATGCQGGSVARYLRSKGIAVHALARDPNSDNAKALGTIGVKLIPGDYDNKAALREAMKGCTGLFLVLMPDFTDLTAEKRWATNVLNSGKETDVKHAIFSSGFSAGNPDQLTAMEPGSFTDIIMRNKHAIENQTRDAGFRYWTILRPGAFMANYVEPFVRMYPDLVDKGVFVTAMKANTVLPLTDTVTIGKFGGEAFLHPAKFHGKEITYADEWIEVETILQKLSKAVGRDLTGEYLSDEEIMDEKATNPFIAGQLVMRDMANLATKEEVEVWGIPLSTFDQFIERETQALHETYHKAASMARAPEDHERLI